MKLKFSRKGKGSVEEIPYTMVREADEGKFRPNYIVQCSKCEETGRVNFQSGLAPNNIVRHKLTRMGWTLGRGHDRSHDLCPKHSKHSEKENDVAYKVQSDIPIPAQKAVNGNIPNQTPDPAPVQPQESFEEFVARIGKTSARIIYSKLDEVYADETIGYKDPDWNDQRVAADLGVDVAWVARIREVQFGPAVIRRKLEDLQAELRAIHHAGLNLRSRLQNLDHERAAITDKLKAINAEAEVLADDIATLAAQFETTRKALEKDGYV